MRKKHALAAAALALVAPLGSLASAGAVPAEKAQAEILGPVTLNEDGSATVTARYICPSGIHLWVSAKQVADGQPDPRLREEGSSQISSGWLQSHPATGAYTCDGTWHVDQFNVDTDFDPENGGGFGTMVPGQAWVQFCLIGDNFSFFLSKTRWVAVV